MIFKNYLFDLDGVLVDTNKIQVHSTIKAILQITNLKITDEITGIIKDTITTSQKLDYLIEKKLIEKSKKLSIYNEKKKNSR